MRLLLLWLAALGGRAQLAHVEDYYSVLYACSQKQLVVAPAHLAKFKLKARLRARPRRRRTHAPTHFAVEHMCWGLLEHPQQLH